MINTIVYGECRLERILDEQNGRLQVGATASDCHAITHPSRSAC